MEFVISSRTEDSFLMSCFLLTFSKINSTAPPFLMSSVSSLIPRRLIRQYSVFYVVSVFSQICFCCWYRLQQYLCSNTNVNGLFIYSPSYIFTTLFFIVFSVSFFIKFIVLYCTVSTYMCSCVLLAMLSVKTLIHSRTYRYQSPVLLSVTLCVITHGLFRFCLLGVFHLWVVMWCICFVPLLVL